ncbi:neuronal acetylcholine receptor subunit alpha-9-like [Pollicipes pollicipes]|uniref:neuronal acetylcholine receptor subunit alpha-9-like n=1 Tax=Pollicipes pollicipes TaxID=41117 RepID=UPI001884B613|nr:neuronal acetylcholine receptor subunit alpha-9-like [Pollicipes pollicipes]
MSSQWLLLLFGALWRPTGGISIETPQYELHRYLFANYSTSIRPIASHTTPTTVEFEVSIYNLIDLNEKNQVMTVNAEIIMKWNDSFLFWNPDNYAGIQDIRVPWKDIWTPDVVLYNSADSAYEWAIYNTLAIVKSSGEVTMLSHAILRSSCEINIRYYPFDQQLCVMSFSSWSQDITQIALVTGPAQGDISAYVENPEFFLENFYVDGLNTTDACCDQPFSTLRYYVQLQRRTAFTMFFFIMPGIFVNLTALMVFMLPCESGEKVSLGISAMLAMMVFLMAMTENLPPSQSIPIAGTYYGTCIGILTANIMASIFVLNIQYKGVWGFPVPNWTRVLMFDFLAKIMFIPVPPRIKGSRVSPKEPAAPTNAPHVPRRAVDLNHLIRYYPRNYALARHIGTPRGGPPAPHPHRIADAKRRRDGFLHQRRAMLTPLIAASNSATLVVVRRLGLWPEPRGILENAALRILQDYSVRDGARLIIPSLDSKAEHSRSVHDALRQLAGVKTANGVQEVLERIERNMAARREQDNVEGLKAALAEEWRLVAYVVDRLSGACFLVITIVFNVAILLSSPEVSKFEYCRGPPGSCN